MPVEIERKYRVADLSCVAGQRGRRLCQGYLHSNDETSLRVRIAAGCAWLTLKGPISGISRSEYEYEIPVADAEAMLREFADRPLIDKTRYVIAYAGMTWEVDIFHGHNAGLAIAEIELASEDQDFALPPWLGPEVTHDRRYSNSHLASHPWRDWGADES